MEREQRDTWPLFQRANRSKSEYPRLELTADSYSYTDDIQRCQPVSKEP